MKVNAITQDRLNELFDYRDGKLIHKKTFNNRVAGKSIGTVNSYGYLTAHVDGITHRVHRLVFLMLKGWSPSALDHIDGDRTNNKIENLRACSATQNQHNTKLSIANKTGVKGVYLCAKTNKFNVRISSNGRRYFIGTFEKLETAKIKASEARLRLHGQFHCEGRV